MMMSLSSEIIHLLSGKTLVTAESCTGGGIGAALTAVPGSSSVYKGGIISYTNWVKEKILLVDRELLETCGAVSDRVACAMADGVRKVMDADIAVSVTGLAGPGGDEKGNAVGTVFIGYSDEHGTCCREFHFQGDREEVRRQAVEESLKYVAEKNGHNL